ncbi:MAG TPA: hypothetical protein DCQ51_03750 [Planktothrix sp. UBA8407]|jgi:Capsular polysaccharide biosynthesis protein|nr:hypothetical protein [Planktothrix sp. UBA8407]HBK23858.1 hypothetical protein [Planktothrix sp. UBA10369]
MNLTKTLASITTTIPSSKIITYPTRLASAWRPKMMEINLPEYELQRPEIHVSVSPSSTRDLNIKPKNFYYKIYKQLTTPLKYEEGFIYDARYDTDGNIAHILTGVTPALLAAQDLVGEKVTVILRSKACTMAKNAYRVLGFPILCTDRDVEGEIISTPSPKGGAYIGWYKNFFNPIQFEGYTEETPEKVFISRKGKRCLINESEIEQILKDYGFQKFYYEDIPIHKQWSVTKNAKVIVALHGAAMASIVFNHNNPKLIELFNPGYVTDKYRHTVAAIGGQWCGITGQMTENLIRDLDVKQNARSFALSPTKIYPDSLITALEYLGIEKS